MERKRRTKRPYLYVFECETPHGFKYRGYSNSIADIPYTFKVNLNKH